MQQTKQVKRKFIYTTGEVNYYIKRSNYIIFKIKQNDKEILKIKGSAQKLGLKG